MQVLDYSPKYLKDKDLPWKEFRLMPIGDIQYPTCDVERLRRHLQWGIENDCYFIGMGDYHDFLSPSNRRALRTAGLYDTANNLIEEWYMHHLNELKDILAPTRGRWLGLLEGHHYFELSDGGTTDTELCQFLDAPFLGTCAVIRLRFAGSDKSQKLNCLIWAHHGEGSTQDPLSRLIKVAPGFPQVDVFLQGHNTQIDARPKDCIEFFGDKDHLRMRDRTQLFAATGGFMRGYQQGSRIGRQGRAQGSYVEKGMMRPTALGGVVIYITPRRIQRKDGFGDMMHINHLDIRASV